jgi:hypothetical protein
LHYFYNAKLAVFFISPTLHFFYNDPARDEYTNGTPLLMLDFILLYKLHEVRHLVVALK